MAYTYYTVDILTNKVVMASDGPNKYSNPNFKEVILDSEKAVILWTEYKSGEERKELCACGQEGLEEIHCHII